MMREDVLDYFDFFLLLFFNSSHDDNLPGALACGDISGTSS